MAIWLKKFVTVSNVHTVIYSGKNVIMLWAEFRANNIAVWGCWVLMILVPFKVAHSSYIAMNTYVKRTRRKNLSNGTPLVLQPFSFLSSLRALEDPVYGLFTTNVTLWGRVGRQWGAKQNLTETISKSRFGLDLLNFVWQGECPSFFRTFHPPPILLDIWNGPDMTYICMDRHIFLNRSSPRVRRHLWTALAQFFLSSLQKKRPFASLIIDR